MSFLYLLLVLLLQVKEGSVFRKNPQFSIRNMKSIYSKETCHYYGEKGHIRHVFHIWNVKIPNGTMA